MSPGRTILGLVGGDDVKEVPTINDLTPRKRPGGPFAAQGEFRAPPASVVMFRVSGTVAFRLGGAHVGT
jgi:hypothetical protein